MTSRERILRMFQHKDADRIPIVDKPWGQDTVDRWVTDGMPASMDYQDDFGFDKMIRFDIDNSPRFDETVREETEEYRVYTTRWGETRKSWRHMTSTPQSIDHIVKTPDEWRVAKARMTPDRDLLKPLHRRVIDWAHGKGIPAYLHSCGNIAPFIPELVGLGLDGLNPIEVKSGLEPLAIKREFGDRLTLHGGMSALLWNDLDEMEAVVREQVPLLKQGGGYIFATDHSIPANVSAQDLKRILDVVRGVGRYA